MFRKTLKFMYGGSATAAIEFSLILIPFMTTIMFIAEICRVIYISSSVDLILSESAWKASISQNPENYERYFNQVLNARIAQWPLLSREVKATVSIKYCDSINQIITGSCVNNNGTSKPLAIYNVKIFYTPLFFIIPASMIFGEIKRSILLVQESQRGG